MPGANVRRAGVDGGFWNNVAVVTPWTSPVAHLPSWANQVQIYVKSSAITTITVQCGHFGNVTSEGVGPDLGSTGPTNWYNLFWNGTASTITFSGAASLSVIIPNLTSKWLRLVGTANATITAGWEAQGN